MVSKRLGCGRLGLDIADSKLKAITDLARKTETPDAPRFSLEATGTEALLRNALKKLSDDELCVLLALASIGRADYKPAQIDTALENAFRRRSEVFADYLATLPEFGAAVEAGARACRESQARSERGAV